VCYSCNMSGKKTVIVTGGAGFIGSHLCERLVADSRNRVISLDNYSAGSRDNHIAGVEYREGHTKDIEKLIPENTDLVFHLGEYARVESSFADITMVLDSNTTGTHGVLEFCRKQNCKIVYAGSSTKFGDGGMGRDQSPYAWTKASNTELVENYCEWFGTPFAITYFYNVYGPRERTASNRGTLIETFCEQYRRCESLTVVSPGTQKRNFTHVSDIVDGLILAGENGHGDGFGLGATESYSIIDVARMFGDNIKMLPERAGNRMSADLDTSKSELLGWKQKRNLKDYISSKIK